MYRTKEDILMDYPELELTAFGDFKIKHDYIKNYEIIDFHCHLYHGLKELWPKFLRKDEIDFNTSFFDISCFPISIKAFDLNEIHYTKIPEKFLSLDGIRTRILLYTGNFMWRKATPERMLRDMKLNRISKAVVMQISPPNYNSSDEMNNIVNRHKKLLTFGSIHPNDNNISSTITKYLSKDIKGWKIVPHVMGENIDNKRSMALLEKLVETGLPIVSCSGLAFSEKVIKSGILSGKLKKQVETQNIHRFYRVLNEFPEATFVLSHGGVYQIEELIKLMHKYPNTYTDISTQPPQNIRKLIKEIGSERMLYGTDYPAYNHAFPMVSVLRATNNEKDRMNIFSNNAKRLLKINTNDHSELKHHCISNNTFIKESS